MTPLAALDAVGLTLGDLATIRAELLAAIACANADLLDSFDTADRVDLATFRDRLAGGGL